MKSSIFLVSLLLTSASYGREEFLETYINPVSKVYEFLGNDNNTVKVSYYNYYETSPVIDTEEERLKMAMNHFNINQKWIRKLSNQKEITEALSKCVFMVEGAYGAHITTSESLALSKALVKMLNQLIVYPTIYKVDNMKVDIIGSGCGVLINGILNSEFALLTAESWD